MQENWNGILKDQTMRKLITLSLSSVVAVLLATLLWSLITREDDRLPDALRAFTLDERPQQDRYLFHYAGSLHHCEEGAHRYLDGLATRVHIEALVVSLPDVPEGYTFESLAVDVANNWRIGAQ
jgi:hypothetical protein